VRFGFLDQRRTAIVTAMLRAAAAATVAAAMLAAAATSSAAAPAAAPKRAPTHGKPNFIFFQPDEMRAESLGCYGHPVAKTPNFDQFAREGTRFDQAHVSYTVCSQSRVSFMTGWPTHVRGHRTLWSLLHDWEPNLLKYFKSEGYSVKWWGKNDLLAPDAFNHSVTSAMSMGGPDNGPNTYDLDTEPGQYYSFLSEPVKGPTNSTMDYRNVYAAIKWLATPEASDKPFTIFLPLLKPHPPYSAPEPWYSSVDPASLPPLRKPDAPGKPDYHGLIRKYRSLTSLDDAFFRKLHAVYLGSIAYSDFLFGLLLAAVEENALASTTTVAVWADHGDYAGDYGLVEKWPSGLEDVLTRVPLLVRTPGGKMGQVVTSPVQLFDIVPTVLELAGINLTHVQFGVSQVPQLMGKPGDASRAVFAEGGYATNEPRDFEGDDEDRNGGVGPPSGIYYPKMLQQQEEPLSVCRSASVRTLTHKLVMRTDPQAADHYSELYDLEADPLGARQPTPHAARRTPTRPQC
jgi:arylsulfatase A-like enzyme